MKKVAHLLLVLVGLGAAFLRWIDLVNFTQLETGFVSVGSVWLRYGALAMLALLALLASFMAARRPKALERTSVSLGIAVAVLGVLCAVYHAASLSVALGLAHLLAGRLHLAECLAGAALGDVGMSVLGLLCAIWLFTVAFSLCARGYYQPAGGVCMGMLGSIYLYLSLIVCFASHQSSFYRLDPTIRVFASAATLWCVAVLLRAIYFPESGVGRKVYCAGMICFYLCVGFVLPQGIFDFVVGHVNFGQLLQQILCAGFGLIGALYAARSLSRDLA